MGNKLTNAQSTNTQEVELTEEQLGELLEELQQGQGEDAPTQSITFDLDVITSMEEFSQPIPEEFDKGVADVSRYVGQFTTLINSGIDSDTATLIMSWIREERMVTDNNKAQVDIVKNQKVAIDKERI